MAAGEPDLVEGETKKGPREEIYYFSQGGELNAIRVMNWKIHFATQVGNIATGTRSTPGWPLLVFARILTKKDRTKPTSVICAGTAITFGLSSRPRVISKNSW